VERLLLALAIVAVAGVVALVARTRRRTDAPTQARYEAPQQLDRADFPHPDHEWLLVAFTSATCHTCADVVAKAAVAASTSVGFAEIEYNTHRDLHSRYRIEAVPTLVLADRDGVVRTSYLGRVTATDLWADIAEAREPGSVGNAACEHHSDHEPGPQPG
jgi:predicted GNAT superfamily acetyltransferase